MSRYLERGATLWSVLSCFIMAGFYAFLGFKMIPSYIDNWQVASALKNVAERADASSMSRSELRAAVRREFGVGYISHVSVSKDLHIERDLRGDHVLNLDYKVRVPIFYNITAVIHFVDRDKVSGT